MSIFAAPSQGHIELECQLLGLCLRGDGLPDLPGLEPEMWTQPIHMAAWRTIQRIKARGLCWPTPAEVGIAICPPEGGEQAQRDCIRYLESCVAMAPIVGVSLLSDAAEELAAAVRDAYGKRRLVELASILGKLAAEPGTTTAEAIASVEKDLNALKLGDPIEFPTLREVTLRIADDLEQPRTVIRTGLPLLDQSVGGGLWTGKLYGVAARMKVGKTVLMGTVGYFAAKQVPTLYIALEMGQVEIAQRVVAGALGMNSVHFLLRDDPELPQRLVGYTCRSDRPELGNLRFADIPGCPFERLKSVCHAAVTQHGVKLIVLDYWQLVRGQAKGETEAQHLANVAQWFADFVRKHQVAGLTAAQINRAGETRGGDGLRMACDWYAHMHPTEAGNPDADRWVEVLDSRYTMRADLGSATQPALYVDNVGPLMREWS